MDLMTVEMEQMKTNSSVKTNNVLSTTQDVLLEDVSQIHGFVMETMTVEKDPGMKLTPIVQMKKEIKSALETTSSNATMENASLELSYVTEKTIVEIIPMNLHFIIVETELAVIKNSIVNLMLNLLNQSMSVFLKPGCVIVKLHVPMVKTNQKNFVESFNVHATRENSNAKTNIVSMHPSNATVKTIVLMDLMNMPTVLMLNVSLNSSNVRIRSAFHLLGDAMLLTIVKTDLMKKTVLMVLVLLLLTDMFVLLVNMPVTLENALTKRKFVTEYTTALITPTNHLNASSMNVIELKHHFVNRSAQIS